MEQHIHYYKGKISRQLDGFIIENATNKELSKLFEYYSCLVLSEKHNKKYHQHSEIPGDYKEENGLPPTEMGVDFCDMADTIGQCKMYSNTSTIGWGTISTFLASRISKNRIKWESTPLLVRLTESKLSDNLIKQIKINEQVLDIPLEKKDFLDCMYSLQKNPVIFEEEKSTYEIRPYQQDVLDIFNKVNDQNITVKLPTGTGKSFIVVKYTTQEKTKKFLILVPKIVLLYQWYEEYQKHTHYNETDIFLVSNEQKKDYQKQRIIVCVYDSVEKILDLGIDFHRIFVDEAHHIRTPEMYKDDDEEDEEEKVIDYSKQTVSFLKKSCKEKGIKGYCRKGISKSDLINLLEKEDSHTYLHKIRTLYQTNKLVEISATIDPLSTHKFYELSIRNAIDQGFLCDYTITVPIFPEDTEHKKICRYLTDNMLYSTIIYCKDIEDAKLVCNNLNSISVGYSDYITCDTPRCKRKLIINRFKSGKLRFLVNVRVLTEGFDSPNTVNVVVLNSSKKDVVIIQILGRCLRLHSSKKQANIIFPVSHKKYSRDVSFFLKTLCKNDVKLSKSWSEKRLNGYVNIIDIEMQEKIEELRRNDPEGLDTEDRIEEIESEENEIYTEIYDSYGKSINTTYKCYLLLEFIEKNGRLPKMNEIYKNINLGGFLHSVKQGYNKDIYDSILCKNPLIREAYEKLQNLKEEKKGKKQYSPQEKGELLLEFVEINGRFPTQNEIYKNIKLGGFLHSVKQGRCKDIYDSILCKNPLIREAYEKVQNLKEEKKGKKQYSPQEKGELLLEFVEINGRLPTQNEIYKSIYIGTFLNRVKQGECKDIYDSILCKNPLIRESYEKIQNLKEEKKGKKQYSPQEKGELLLEFVEINGRLPTHNEIYKSINLGTFLNSVKRGRCKDIYDSILCKNPLIREAYEKVQNLKEEKKGKKQYSPQEKGELLLEFVEINGRLPTHNEIYKNINLGTFLDSVKRGYNKDIYDSILCKNPLIRESYEKIQNLKEEKKGKKQYSPQEKGELLLEFVEINGRLPTQNEIYKNINLGTFLDSVKRGYNKDIYDNILCKNPLIRESYEKIQNLKEEKKKKVKIF